MTLIQRRKEKWQDYPATVDITLLNGICISVTVKEVLDDGLIGESVIQHLSDVDLVNPDIDIGDYMFRSMQFIPVASILSIVEQLN